MGSIGNLRIGQPLLVQGLDIGFTEQFLFFMALYKVGCSVNNTNSSFIFYAYLKPCRVYWGSEVCASNAFIFLLFYGTNTNITRWSLKPMQPQINLTCCKFSYQLPSTYMS